MIWGEAGTCTFQHARRPACSSFWVFRSRLPLTRFLPLSLSSSRLCRSLGGSSTGSVQICLLCCVIEHHLCEADRKRNPSMSARSCTIPCESPHENTSAHRQERDHDGIKNTFQNCEKQCDRPACLADGAHVPERSGAEIRESRLYR